MRKWLTVLLLLTFLAFPTLAAAQDEIRLEFVEVRLWPEYDQPGMLVIYDFQADQNLQLPVRLDFRIPSDASINAVAALQNGEFITGNSEGPKTEGEWNIITILVESPTIYRLEYYQPLNISESVRQFSYLWLSDYAVDSFDLSVQKPVDATNMSTDPAFEPKQDTDGLTYFNSPSFSLKAGEQFTLNIQYQKSTDRLTAPDPNIQPSSPLNEDTSGRVSLSNYIPYIIGASGVIIVVGALGYYFLWGRPRSAPARPRRRARSEQAAGIDSEIYCPQCGQRARAGDRFCRVCGTRLRQPKES